MIAFPVFFYYNSNKYAPGLRMLYTPEQYII